MNTKKKNIIKDSDTFIGIVLGMAFLKTIVLQFLHLIYGANNSNLAIIVYGFLFIYLFYGLIKFKLINHKKFLCYLLVLFFFFICYVLGPHKCQKYYFDIEMLLSYFYYIPIAIFLIPDIKKPLAILDCIAIFRYVSVIIAAYMLFVGSYSTAEQDNYMEFSYALLPFVICSFYTAFNKSKILDYGLYVLGIILMVYYGARTPLVISLSFPLIMAILSDRDSKNRRKRAVVIGSVLVVFIVFIFNSSVIVGALGRFGSNVGSYALMKLEANAFTESAGRDNIYDNAIMILSQDYLKPYGLFSDRILLDVIYVHNIFLELFFNFGVFGGGIIALVLVILIIKSAYVNWHGDASYLLIFFLLVVFLRFILSGSYLIEGMSYVHLALLLKFRNKYTQPYVELKSE